MGYSGGTIDDPDYYHIGDYSETVEVVFDPAVVTYQQLLQAFWNGHNTSSPPYSIQYRSAVFCTSERQMELANEYKLSAETSTDKTIYTDIEPFTRFYVGEDYHQKYYLKWTPDVAKDLYAIYPAPADFRDSTAAARLNGYVGGFGDADALQKNIDNLGLSEAGKQALQKAVQHGLKNICPVNVP